MPGIRYLILVLLLVAAGLAGCASSRAKRPEKTFPISGYVLDSVSRKPVAGILVGPAYWGNYLILPQTDKSGHFVLRLPVSQRKLSSQIIVKSVLYEGQASISADTTVEVTMLLHRNKRQLPTDPCAGIADSLRMNPYASHATSLPGRGLALFIENKPRHPTNIIRTIAIDAEKIGLEDGGAYWFRISQAKGPDHAPGEELLGMSGFVGFRYGVGKQWIDLSDWGIAIPEEGILVELEAMAGCDKCFQLNMLENYNPSGPLLSPPCTLAEAHNWLYEYRTGWRPLTPAENPVPLFHSGLQVELMGPK